MILSTLIIFLAKIIEVSLTTVKTIFITKKEKTIASIIAFFEIMLWLVVVSRIIVDITSYPNRMIAYALGYALGHFVGLSLEERLNYGLVTLEIILNKEDGNKLAQYLRDKKIGVTEIKAYGRVNEKRILMIHLKRKIKNEVIDYVKNSYPDAFITIRDVASLYGGYGVKK
ncbi:hypothetical protein D3C76_683470 [compost metagenome]|jgi:uncharacterized protein YebE (UPF0316 family)|uniref:UPF0316 protein SAMN02745941_01938 n=1 Tax=Clostridium intestinale DSM 6191 TaxID=1121320 RepID=A0A1M5YFB5_9CLOT|nr:MULTISPECIES: DUF5698 domain-containing protein [Clostridium]SHI10538.1 Uncharacterized protein YebE, UPF0316 family [Clostridium intestinale DSM 6191]